MWEKIILVTIFIFSSLHAQSSHILKSSGELIDLKNKNIQLNSTNKKSLLLNESILKSGKSKGNNVTGVKDTLNYSREYNFNTNFGFNSQDVLIQYFMAPADMIVNAVGFSCADDSGAINGSDVFVRLIKLNWSYDSLVNVNDDINLGYYPYNDSLVKVDYFGENSNGNWIDKTEGLFPLPPWTNNSDPSFNTFEYNIWSDSSKGVNIIPEKQISAGNYQFIETNVLGFEPEINSGEIIGVVIKHNGTTFNNDRIGFYADTDARIPGLKFYAKGRNDSTDIGWWIRQITFDFALAVDLVSGPRISIYNITELNSTISTDPREVQATIVTDNPSGGPYGIESALLLYSINGGSTFDTSKMIYEGNFIYSGEIPGQLPNTEIIYYIKAIDIEGNFYETISHSYKIFKPTENVNTLLIFNGLPESGYPSSYYFGQDDFIDNIPIDFPHDVWAFDEFDSTLVNNYQNIFEITSNGPNYYHRNIIRNWLEEDNNRNYFLAGDEWLGAENGFTDTSFLPGSFEYDILGITKSYNDVSYDGTSGQLIPSKLLPVENSLLGGALNNLFIKNGPTDSLRYDPVYENSWINNWIDAFEVVDTNNIDLLVETRGINGLPSVQIKPCAVHNVTPDGNKIAFLAYDPISINSSPEYYWYGFSETSLQVQTLKWFGIITDVNDKQGEIIPSRIQLFQNYPNPFNPTTKIKYQIPQVIARSEATQRSYEITSGNSFPRNDNMNVSLKVYDILGREVIILVNQKQKPGIYEIEFDAVNLPSGIYFYKLNYGYFSQTKKMILIK